MDILNSQKYLLRKLFPLVHQVYLNLTKLMTIIGYLALNIIFDFIEIIILFYTLPVEPIGLNVYSLRVKP